MVKPILFNSEMVRVLEDNHKSMVRLPVKFPSDYNPQWAGYVADGPVLYGPNDIPAAKCPYKPGDILWVRETWCNINKPECEPDYYYYADVKYWEDYYPTEWKWSPSSNMPRDAARIFLRIKSIRAERLRYITDVDAKAEGVNYGVTIEEKWAHSAIERYADLWNRYAKPMPIRENGILVRYESYPFEDTYETRTYRGKPWRVLGNPWVWVIEFEKVNKPEGWPNLLRPWTVLRPDMTSYTLYSAVKPSAPPGCVVLDSEDDFTEEKDTIIENIWDQLEDVPFDEKDDGSLVLAEPWRQFPAGTDREEIWHWFDRKHSKGVHYLLYVRSAGGNPTDENKGGPDMSVMSYDELAKARMRDPELFSKALTIVLDKGRLALAGDPVTDDVELARIINSLATMPTLRLLSFIQLKIPPIAETEN